MSLGGACEQTLESLEGSRTFMVRPFNWTVAPVTGPTQIHRRIRPISPPRLLSLYHELVFTLPQLRLIPDVADGDVDGDDDGDGDTNRNDINISIHL